MARGGAWSGAITLKLRAAKDPGMRSNGFDFIQTAPRQSPGFLIFNQSFSFKRDSENAERRQTKGRARREAIRENSTNELKEGQNVRSANSLHSVTRLRISFTGLGHSGTRHRAVP